MPILIEKNPAIFQAKKSRVKSAPVTTVTEGQRRLLGVTEPLATIARKVGCSRMSVSDWRRGNTAPSEAFRFALEISYGIPVDAWLLAPAPDPGACTAAECEAFLAGTASPTPAQAERICEVFGIPPESWNTLDGEPITPA